MWIGSTSAPPLAGDVASVSPVSKRSKDMAKVHGDLCALELCEALDSRNLTSESNQSACALPVWVFSVLFSSPLFALFLCIERWLVVVSTKHARRENLSCDLVMLHGIKRPAGEDLHRDIEVGWYHVNVGLCRRDCRHEASCVGHVSLNVGLLDSGKVT
jgi:hypothetical protein